MEAKTKKIWLIVGIVVAIGGSAAAYYFYQDKKKKLAAQESDPTKAGVKLEKVRAEAKTIKGRIGRALREEKLRAVTQNVGATDTQLV